MNGLKKTVKTYDQLNMITEESFAFMADTLYISLIKYHFLSIPKIFCLSIIRKKNFDQYKNNIPISSFRKLEEFYQLVDIIKESNHLTSNIKSYLNYELEELEKIELKKNEPNEIIKLNSSCCDLS